MTLEELARHDGRDGRKAYIAVNRTIYDVTASKLWVGGDHMKQHQAGQDLTEALLEAPHVRAVVERFPAVGRIEEAAPAPSQGSGKTISIVAAALVALTIAVLLLR